MNKKLYFSTESWHACSPDDWQDCTEGINCYSYILNKPEYYWSIPGMGFTKDSAKKYINDFNAYFKAFSLQVFREKLIKGAIKDGLTLVTELIDKDGYYLAALFFPPGDHDFHWYRNDDNGLWSHKDGWRSASDKDDAGNTISDPRSSVSRYTVFGGFFLVPRQGITLPKNLWT